MKFFSLLAWGTAVTAVACTKRTTKIAGVEVIDTQIVRDAQALIRQFPDFLYWHQMRSWVFGAAMIAANETLRNTVDLEVHAVATMLHDLGWDMTPGSRWVSQDKRFEVDGAIGARTWLSEHPIGKNWAPERVRKVFQSIALHGVGTISDYFETEINVIVNSILQDYQGPLFGLSQEIYDGIVKEFPQTELKSGTNATFVWMCETKPAVTYDTWIQFWGDAFVPGYSAVGHRVFDTIV